MKALPLKRPSFFYKKRCFQKTTSHALGSKVMAVLKMFSSLNVNLCNNVHDGNAVNEQHEQSRILDVIRLFAQEQEVLIY